MNERPRHLDLFSGIGGFSLAFEAEGFHTVGFSEFDPFASAVLRKHWPDVRNYGDVTKWREWPDIACDVITGGFPCQPFSVAGRRGGKADNRNLWPSMLDVIKRFRPAFVLGENVVGIESMVLTECLDDLERAGYRAVPFDISACAVGLPTLERHIWIIAEANGHVMERNTAPLVSRSAVIAERDKDCSGDAELLQRPALPASVLLRSRKGFPDFVDRVKSIGNAIPPQVAQVFAKAIYGQLTQ